MVFENVIDPEVAKQIYDFIPDDCETMNFDVDDWPFPQVIPVLEHCAEQYMSHKSNKQKPELLSIHCFSLQKYCEENNRSFYYEVHDDIDDGVYLTSPVYLTPDADEWRGGELIIHGNFTYQDYPHNTLQVKPKFGRAVFFPANVLHRVKPWMSDTPRKTLAFSWGLKEDWRTDLPSRDIPEI